jgi:hypothetical protein
MAFLDNSGDIILDCVLTDTARMRLAKGDGSFKITKFAIADDEINYELYRNSNHPDGAHASGSAYYDLEILQTPLLEAFTDNAASLKSKLMSHTNTNVLYLPMLKLSDGTAVTKSTTHHSFDSTPSWKTYIVAVDTVTETAFNQKAQGVMWGATYNEQFIRVEQGLDTTDVAPTTSMDKGLLETQYLIEIDNRLGTIISKSNQTATLSFIDDDNIATYLVTMNTDPTFVTDISSQTGKYTDNTTPIIKGPRGSRLDFAIRAALEIQKSNFLFTKFGSSFAASVTWPTVLASGNNISTNNLDTRSDNGELLYIDSIVRVTGILTGYRLDIPIRFIKCTGCVTS